MKKIFLLSIYIVLILFINNKVYSAPLVFYDYEVCNYKTKKLCNIKDYNTEISILKFGKDLNAESEYDMLFEYRNTLIKNRSLGWDIKAKEIRSQCRDVKEVDRISCLVLNVVKICEKNPKLNYCELIINDSNGKVKKANKNIEL